MAKYADLCESGQIVMTRQLGQSISNSAGLVWYSHSALVSIYQKWHSGEPATGSWWSKGWPLWSNPTDELGFRLHSTSEFVVYGVVQPQTSQGVHADYCSPLRAPKMGILASQLDHGAMLLLTSWCQRPQDTSTDLVESMPWQVRAGLAAKARPTRHQAGGHNVISVYLN